MSRTCILSVMISFAVSAGLGSIMIPFLRRLKVGQTVRDDGPQSHLKKSGTPTMGGILILVSVLAASIPFLRDRPLMMPILFLTAGFGLIGFLDDYIKVVLHRSMGLSAAEKFSAQVLVTAVFLYYIHHYTDLSLAMRIPFWPGKYLDLGPWNLVLLSFMILGTVNGVNFTDGLDGLAASVTVIIAVFFSVTALGTRTGIEPVTCAVTGALMAFLLFNVHPASVFMGDTGSLALGGFVAATACILQMPLYIAVIGFVYLAEVFSVILQVTYFKCTGGRRLFKMAPLHHHFELCGWSETRIVALFSMVTALMCLFTLLFFP